MEAGVDPEPLANGLSPLDLAAMNDDGEGSHARVVELLGDPASSGGFWNEGYKGVLGMSPRLTSPYLRLTKRGAFWRRSFVQQNQPLRRI